MPRSLPEAPAAKISWLKILEGAFMAHRVGLDTTTPLDDFAQELLARYFDAYVQHQELLGRFSAWHAEVVRQEAIYNHIAGLLQALYPVVGDESGMKGIWVFRLRAMRERMLAATS